MEVELISKQYIAKKLKWDIHGIFDDIKNLKEKVEEDKLQLSKQNLKEHRKMDRWLKKFTEILNRMDYINNVLISRIENTFQYQFESKELVKLVFFRPSIKNLFNELSIYFEQIKSQKISVDFETLSNLGDAAEVMALLGDSALDLALAQLFWEPKIARVGNISIRRANLVSNENLSITCDTLNLYEYRIHNEPSLESTKEETIQHTKGTLIEAIYGIIYTEKGIDAVFDALVAIK